MKKKKFITLLLMVFLMVPFLCSCTSKSNYINPKLSNDKHSDLAGTMGNQIVLKDGEKYSGFLGYGYDIVGKGYFNSGDVSTKALIFDMDALAKDGLVYTMPKSDTTSALYAGSTVMEYQQDISSKIGLSTSYGLFFTSVSSDFSISKDSSTTTSTKHIYLKNMVSIQRERQYIQTSLATLKKHITSDVLEALSKDTSTLSATDKQAYYETLFSTYGTHVMLDIVLGGRMDLNYVYDNSNKTTATQLKIDFSAVYSNLRSSVTGSVSEEIKTKSNLLVSKTSFNGRRLGGSTAGDISTYEDAKASYEEWAKSIEANKTLELIDVGESCATSLLPIWELVDDASVQQNLKVAYTQYLSTSGKLFADFDEKNSVNTIPDIFYIKKIYVGINENSAMALSDAVSQISHDDPNIASKPLNFDLNKGVGGNYVYLNYTLTTNPAEAITDVRVEWYNKESNAPATTNHDGHTYTCIKKDLNSGAGGKYIYIYYTKDTSAGTPLKDLGVENDGSFSFGDSASGWVSVLGLTSDDKADCNKGSGGPFIYLWYHR